MEIMQIIEGVHYVQAQIRMRDNGLVWDLINVYGAAQLSGKEAFLKELAHVCARIKNPTCIGGDFSLIRRAKERNPIGECTKWNFLFNAIIEIHNLVDLPLANRTFTWCNDHEYYLCQVR